MFHAGNGSLAFALGSHGAGDGHFIRPASTAFAAPHLPIASPLLPGNGTVAPSDAPPAWLRPGMIAVAERGNHRIQVFDSNGTFAFKFGSNGTGDGEFNQPISVAISPSGGRIAVADIHNHRIQVFHADGTFAFKFGSEGAGDGDMRWPASVLYSPDGTRIAVADYGNNRIQVFYSNGTFDFAFGSTGAAYGQFNTPWSAAYSPDGTRIAVADALNHRIQIFHAGNGTFDSAFGGRHGGDAPGDFSVPRAVAYSPDGEHLAVVDRANSRIQVFYTTNNTVSHVFGEQGFGHAQFDNPASAAYSPDGSRIAVADMNNHRIQIFHAGNGTFDSAFGPASANEGRLVNPASVSFVPSPPPWPIMEPGMFAVADINNHRIQVFHTNGTFYFKFGTFGRGDGELDYPNSVAFSPYGDRIAVSDRNRIHIFHIDGTFDFAFGSRGIDDEQFGCDPYGVSYSPDGSRIAVADPCAHRIQVFHAASGTFDFKFGRLGSYEGQLRYPKSVEYSADGKHIVAASEGAKSVKVYHSNGTFDYEFGMIDPYYESFGQNRTFHATAAASSPDGKLFLVSYYHPAPFTRIMYYNGTVVYDWPFGRSWTSIDFSPFGDKFIQASTGGYNRTPPSITSFQYSCDLIVERGYCNLRSDGLLARGSGSGDGEFSFINDIDYYYPVP